MEIAGLAIGVVGLAGQLTKASIECYSIFSEIGDVGYSQDSILHEIQTEAFRLRQWEQGWNLSCSTTSTRQGQRYLDPNDVHYRYALASLARIVLGFTRLAELISGYNKELEKVKRASGRSRSKQNTLAPDTGTGRITRARSKSPRPNTPPSGPSNSAQILDITQKLSKLKFWENPKSLQDPQSLPGLAEEIASLHEVMQSVQHALPGYRKLRWVLVDKEKYNAIVHQLKKYIDGLFMVLPPNPPSFPQQAPKKLELSFKIPFKAPNIQKDSHFVQRHDLNRRLRDKIQIGTGVGNINQVVLYGTGGMGKTQLALNYVSCYHQEYSAVFWMNAASEQTMKLAFAEIMQRLIHTHAHLSEDPMPDYTQIGQLLGMTGKLDSTRFGAFSVQEPAEERHVVEAVKQWLSTQGNTQWLLVFDNLDDLESFDIKDYTPSCWHGTIIITSRRPESLIGRTGFEVQSMEQNEAQVLLLQSSHRDLDDMSDGERKQEQKAISTVAQRLGYLPLALDHAGSYIFREQCTFMDYLKELVANISFYLSKGWKQGGDKESVFASWEMSFKVLQTRVPKATELLSICGFLDNEDISEEFLLRGMKLENNDTEFRESIQALCSYSFAKKKKGKKSFNIHPLVHVWARNRLTRESSLYSKKLSEALTVVSCALGKDDWDSKSAKDWEFEHRHMPHIDAIQCYIGELNLAMENIGISRCIERLGWFYKDHGRFGRAKNCYQLVLVRMEQQLGSHHLDTLRVVHEIASLFEKEGNYDVALEWYQRVLAGKEKHLGAEHPSTLTTVHNMASLFETQGKYDMALEWYQRVLAGKEKHLGAEHPSTLTTVHNMASLFETQGKYDMALEWYQHVLAGDEKHLGTQHPDTLTTVHNMASLFETQGKYDMALEWYQRVLASKEKHLGAEHPSTLTTVHNMASLFETQGKYDMALEWYERALAGREKHLGVEYPDTQSSIKDLEMFYKERNMIEEAKQLRSRFPSMWPASDSEMDMEE